jgi:hypothetical protein
MSRAPDIKAAGNGALTAGRLVASDQGTAQNLAKSLAPLKGATCPR